MNEPRSGLPAQLQDVEAVGEVDEAAVVARCKVTHSGRQSIGF
jgi:hypothetical protein